MDATQQPSIAPRDLAARLGTAAAPVVIDVRRDADFATADTLVASAFHHDPDQVGRWWHGWNVLGTDVPTLFAAGTFYYHGELVFWDVSDPAGTIVVSLNHERYKKLIVEVADPQAVVIAIRSALRK